MKRILVYVLCITLLALTCACATQNSDDKLFIANVEKELNDILDENILPPLSLDKYRFITVPYGQSTGKKLFIGAYYDYDGYLLCADIDNDYIASMKNIELENSGKILSLQVIEISQGNYLEITTQSRKGFITTELIAIDTLTPYALFETGSSHFNGFISSNEAKANGIPIDGDGAYGYSFIYEDVMFLDYKDVNKDSFDDVVISGVKLLVKDNEYVDYDIISRFYVVNVYEYDNKLGEWVFNKLLSKETKIDL